MDQPVTPLEEINARIAATARIAGRSPDDITLLAISKMQPAERIVPLIEQGQMGFGENRVQEAQEKWPGLRERFDGIALHMVGQLQSNKAEDAVSLFDCIHSLDRRSLVTALAKAMDKAARQVPCFVQVDIGEEQQKGGCPITQVPDLLRQSSQAGVPVIGLMCVPPLGIEPAPFFALLAKIADDNGLTKLSMGMSGDFETAVMLGATHVRVGTALFGERG